MYKRQIPACAGMTLEDAGATAKELRGPGLTDFIGKALEKKKEK